MSAGLDTELKLVFGAMLVLPVLFAFYTALPEDDSVIGSRAPGADPGSSASAGSSLGSREVFELDFNWKPVEPDAGDQVFFDSSSTLGNSNVRSYRWYFGNGKKATGRTARTVYMSGGSYTVRLETVLVSGATESLEKQVYVESFNRPDVSIEAGPGKPLTRQEMFFSPVVESGDNSVIDAYLWDLDGDGMFEKRGTNVSHSFATAGEKDVSLRLNYTNSLDDTVSESFRVGERNQGPDAGFRVFRQAASGEILFNASQSSDDEGITAYRWDLDNDSVFERSGRKIEASYAPGKYTVRLEVEDREGLTDSFDRAFTVEETNSPPLVNIKVEPVNPLVDESIDFRAEAVDTDGSVEEYRWDLDGSGDYEKSGESVVTEFQDSGARKVSVKVRDNKGATATDSVDLEVKSREVELFVYINESEDISESDYSDYMEQVSSEFQKAGDLDIEFRVVGSSTFGRDESCVSKATFDDPEQEDYDLAICAGPGQGGFWGSRINVVGHNTGGNFPFGNEQDIHTVVHEWIHYFGFQDVYGYPQDMPRNWISNDIMGLSVYDDNPNVSNVARKIIRFNHEQLQRKGRKAIYYPKVPDGNEPPEYRKHRMPDYTDISVELPEKGSCRVYNAKDGTEIGSYTTSDGKLKFDMSTFSQYRGIKLVCFDEKVYWLPFFKLDKCFINNDYESPDTCSVSCQNNNTWCSYSSVS